MAIESRAFGGKTHDFEQAVRAFSCVLRGELIIPGHEEYDQRRRIHFGNYDVFPELIVRAIDVTDVIASVHFAREHGLRLAIRSGGHSVGGHSTRNGALIIDLAGLRTLDINPETGVARVGPGLRWKEVTAEAEKHGLVLQSGDVGSVGVGGLTVGGGIGWMVRKHGMTIDHLLSADVVTADGRLVTASPTENPDLFWAIRGGGSNFGIVTSFEFQMHRHPLIFGGAVFYRADRAKEILRFWEEYCSQAPDELTSMAFVMKAPPAPFIPLELQGQIVIALMACWSGDIPEGERVLAPLRQIETPIADLMSPMPYSVMFKMLEDAEQDGAKGVVRSAFVDELSDDLLDTFMQSARSAPAPIVICELRVLGGAMSRVPETETAFPHRKSRYMLAYIASWFPGMPDEPNLAWAQNAYEALEPYRNGVYVNFLANEGQDRIREAYGPNYTRLEAVKAKYDPENVFDCNQNITPAR